MKFIKYIILKVKLILTIKIYYMVIYYIIKLNYFLSKLCIYQHFTRYLTQELFSILKDIQDMVHLLHYGVIFKIKLK